MTVVRNTKFRSDCRIRCLPLWKKKKKKKKKKSRKRKSITYTRQYLNRLNFGYLPIPTHFHCVRSGLFVCAIIIISINHKNCILTLYHKSGICGELEWTLLIWLAFQIVEFVALPVPKTLDILKREMSTYDIILFKAFSSLYCLRRSSKSESCHNCISQFRLKFRNGDKTVLFIIGY